jgi:catechol 2,3-dioxygenase-like lactoylglutathione lyase family enzyme
MTQMKRASLTLIVLSASWPIVIGAITVKARMANRTLVPNPLPAEPRESQPVTSTARQPLMNGVGAFFALSVPDINASAKWYSDKLGLKVVMRPPKAGQASVIVLEGGGLIVELIQHDDALPLSKAGPTVKDNLLVHGIFKAGVIVEDFDRTIANLRARNVPIAFGPFPARDGQRANVIIRDNSGNLIQFFGK